MASRSTAPGAAASEGAPGGLLMGIAAYGLWGLLPLYLRLIAAAPPEQILAHRILWSMLLLALVALILRRIGAIRAVARGRTLALLCGSATLIAVNWLVYLLAVAKGHVLEASLGYFINPLVTVALGVVVLGERLRRMQGWAIALAAAGVAALLAADGGAIWVPLLLAFSFAGYALVRKIAAIDALGGLFVETLLLAPPAAVYLWLVARAGDAAFGHDLRLDLLLVCAGLATSVPLLLFAAAARRLPMATVGLLQYIAPSLQLTIAVLVFGEPLRPIHALVFGLIWSGLALYIADALVRRRMEPVAAPE